MNVFVTDEQPLPLDTLALRRLAEQVLRAEGLPDATEVTVILVSDDDIAGYNAAFLGREGPTDVLAFPLEDLAGGIPPSDPAGPPLHLGDVVIAPAYVSRQATEMEEPFEAELALMLVHGLLHLLGYDHETDEEAVRMEGRERELLGLVGLGRR